MRRSWKQFGLEVVLTLAAFTARPLAAAPADPTCWVVLRDGRALALRCPWRLREDRLEARGLDGVLVALPRDWVDFAATAAARARPSPRAARLVSLAPPPAESRVSAVGLAGLAAKRAGLRGAFFDLSQARIESAGSGSAAASAEPPGAPPKPALRPRRRGGRQ